MARIPRITRNITTTKAKVLCLSIEKQEPFFREVVLPRTYKTEEQLLNEIRKVVDNENVKAVHIDSVTIEKTLYGMSEQKFIENAEKLPARYKNSDECEECKIDN